MNSLFLLLTMLVAFVFGYRFYAKWLALDVFPLREKYSTPAHTRFDERDYVPAQRHLLFGHHVAAVATGALFLGPLVAAGWGWIPAFLWLVAGSAVAAGAYGLGSYWLVARHPLSLPELAQTLLGQWGRYAVLALAVPALLIAAAAGAGLVAALLAAYPTAALPLAATALIAPALGGFLHGRPQRMLAPASAAALALAVLLVWLLDGTSFAFTGALSIDFGGRTLVAIDAVTLWLAAVLAYAFVSARAPVWRLIRPLGYLMALVAVLAIGVFYAGLVVEHPALVAPQFHTEPDRPGALPWLYLVVSSGALAGFQFLIVHGVTGRQLRRMGDVRFVGYGGALAEGAIALAALLIAATSFGDAEAWSSYFRSASLSDVSGLFRLYVDGYARFAGAVGLAPEFARALAVTVAAGLALSTVEACVRALHRLAPGAAEGAAVAGGTRPFAARSLWLVVAAVALVALSDGHGRGGVEAWRLFACFSLWLAALGFGMMAIALRADGRAFAPALALAGAAALVALWASIAQLIAWWTAGDAAYFGMGLAGALLALVACGRAGQALTAEFGLRLPGT